MGTQFWWIFDVITLSITAGVIYGAVQKGLNKVILPLLGYVAAIVAGIFGSNALEGVVYEHLFQEEIRTSVQSALTVEEWDLLDAAAETLAIAGQDTSAEEVHKLYRDAADGGEPMPDWLEEGICRTAETVVSARQRAHSEIALSEVFGREDLMTFLASLYGDKPEEAATLLEEKFYQPPYREIAHDGLFLMIELAMLIIYSMIASVAGNLEEQMHIRRGNRLLAFPAGLVEAACLLLIFVIVVRLIVRVGDGEIVLFNRETIGETWIFRYLYELVAGS